jgi:hypothetical protein
MIRAWKEYARAMKYYQMQIILVPVIEARLELSVSDPNERDVKYYHKVVEIDSCAEFTGSHLSTIENMNEINVRAWFWSVRSFVFT